LLLRKIAADVITPIKYKIPASPLACEQAEKKKVDLKKIFTAYKQICRNSDFVIAEGIGGVKVPLTMVLTFWIGKGSETAGGNCREG
jgi:dethiobiotin synthetase